MPPYKPSVWDLQEIKPQNIHSEELRIENAVQELEKKKSLLTVKISSSIFLRIMRDFENLRKLMEKIGVFTQLRFAENAGDQKAVAEMSQVEHFLTRMNNRLLFFSLWFKQLPKNKAQELTKASGQYHYFLQTLSRTRKYTLKETEEKIINIKDNSGVSALNNIYNILTSEFEYFFTGKKRTQEEMVTFVRSTSLKTREAAYHALLKPYIQQKNALGEIYKNIILDWREENIGLRGYKNPLGVRNIVNDLPDQAVQTLLTVCEKNQFLFQKFFEIKRKKLGLQKLRRFDLYAPLAEEDETISYDQAVKSVLDTFQDFFPQCRQIAAAIIEKKHVHSMVQKGKRSGAFCCPATTEVLPYVLLSYTGKYRDVSTLAHELGHAVHMTLSQKQSEFTMDACLPLAETASIFAEMLLSERMLKANPEAAKQMLFTKMDDLYASIIRQAGFVRFEMKAHELFHQGKTIDEVSQVYLADLRKQLGSRIEVDDIFAYEWLYIPHIFQTPFYCYAYAFGNLLTLALYEMYKEQGSSFALKIIEMLSKGGSESPQNITKAVGVDITSEKFWQKGFMVIERMMKELEE